MSPKRKQPNPGISTQRSNDVQNPTMLFSMNAPVTQTTSKNAATKQTQQMQMQAAIESLVQKIETNTVTIAGLKTSVDSMHGTISKQEEVVVESIRNNNEGLSSIKSSLSQAQSLIQSVKKQTFSSIVKGATTTDNYNYNAETPKSSKAQGKNIPSKTKTPSTAGTANKLIGKPLSPAKPRQKTVKKLPEKAIWIGRLHRDTTTEEISSYIKNELNITNVDQLEIRKLVKKDRDLSEYSFVSFRVACSAELFNILLDAKKWPSYCQIREFKIEPAQPMGARINNETPSKNEIVTRQADQTPQVEQTSQDMETID